MEHIPAAMNPRQAAVSTSEPDVYDDGFLRVEHDSYYVSCDGSSIFLPRKEFLILSRLTRNVNHIVSTRVLWEYAWGAHQPCNAASLRVYVCHLRKKLLPFGLNIKTLTSVGYCLCLRQHVPGTRRNS